MLIDAFFCVITFCAGIFAKLQSRIGPERLPISYRLWDRFKIMPVSYHYYQPIFDPHAISREMMLTQLPLADIDLNIQRQLDLLKSFHYQIELNTIPRHYVENYQDYYHGNPSIGVGDAELLYNIIRKMEPGKIIEIGAGYSTLLIRKALLENHRKGLRSEHICIEPYEMPWLDEIEPIKVIRSPIQDVDMNIIDALDSNDILFIDSSHVIRTGGDVTYNILYILPRLKPGVIIHFHDIFLPSEYPEEWIKRKRRYWTEQYLLLAFLMYNKSFEILCSAHYIAIHHRDVMELACPTYSKMGGSCGSFWIRKI